MKTIKFKENHEVRKGIIFLIFALLCSLNLSAQTEFVIGNLKYTTTSSSTVSVSKNEIITGKLVIPETVKYNGTQYSVTSIGNWAFWGCTGLTSVTIPNSVTSIEGSAFRDCNSLTSVTIGNSVTSIGESAFKDCRGLTSVTIGNSVTSIGELAFSYCSGLTSITIPNSVTSIGKEAFSSCTGLTSVTIPNSVTSIGESAFVGCSSLTGINVDENNTAYSSIDGVLFNKSQTELVLYPGRKRGAYVIPNSVTSIGELAFCSCKSLTSITIGNSVTSIGYMAFWDCTGLTSVTIPNSVTSIGYLAFDYCSGLTDIYCHIEEPLTIESGIFYYVTRNTCTLHVPIGSKVKYEAADVWKSFLNIVEDLPTGIVSIDNSQLTIDNDVWFTLNGVRLNGKPTRNGVYLVKYNNGNIRKVMIK